MAKKILTLTLSVLVLAFCLNAEDAKKPADPKIGVELTQRMDAEFVDGTATPANTYGFDTIYSRSEIKGSSIFDLGSGFTITASAKDRLEVRLNPGNLEGVDAGIEYLGKIRDRNRFYLALEAGLALDKAFNVALATEYRLATDLRTDKEGTIYPEGRVAPSLNLNGKIDIFSYSLVTAFNLYLDTNWANTANDFYPELEGTYGLGLGLKLDDASTLKLDLGEYILDTFPTAARQTAGDVGAFTSNLSFKATLATATFSPMVGFIWNSVSSATGVNTSSVVGGTCGVEFKKDNWAFSVGADVGANSVKNNALESHLYAQIKIKA